MHHKVTDVVLNKVFVVISSVMWQTKSWKTWDAGLPIAICMRFLVTTSISLFEIDVKDVFLIHETAYAFLDRQSFL